MAASKTRCNNVQNNINRLCWYGTQLFLLHELDVLKMTNRSIGKIPIVCKDPLYMVRTAKSNLKGSSLETMQNCEQKDAR